MSQGSDANIPAPEEQSVDKPGQRKPRTGLPSLSYFFENVIRYCEEDITQLYTESLLVSDLTNGKKNPLNSKLEQAISWTTTLKELCENNRNIDPRGLESFEKSTKAMLGQFTREFNPMMWVDAAAAILKERPDDKKLAEDLEFRRHQIINCLSAFAHVEVLGQWIEIHAAKAKEDLEKKPSNEALDAMFEVLRKLPQSESGEKADSFARGELGIHFKPDRTSYKEMAALVKNNFKPIDPEYTLLSRVIKAGADKDGVSIPGMSGRSHY